MRCALLQMQEMYKVSVSHRDMQWNVLLSFWLLPQQLKHADEVSTCEDVLFPSDYIIPWYLYGLFLTYHFPLNIRSLWSHLLWNDFYCRMYRTVARKNDEAPATFVSSVHKRHTDKSFCVPSQPDINVNTQVHTRSSPLGPLHCNYYSMNCFEVWSMVRKQAGRPTVPPPDRLPTSDVWNEGGYFVTFSRQLTQNFTIVLSSAYAHNHAHLYVRVILL